MTDQEIYLPQQLSLVESHRSFGRLAKTLLAEIGVSRRFGAPARQRPKNGELFGQNGRLLAVGHTRGMTISKEPDTSPVLEATIPSSAPDYRAEFIPLTRYFLEEKFSYFHVPMAYEFDVKLDKQSLGDPADQCIAQWHGIPNRLFRSPQSRHAPFLLGIIDGRYTCISAASRKLAPRIDASGDSLSGLDRVRRVELHDPKDDVDQWVTWRLEVCWAFSGSQGWWRLFRNKTLVAEDEGPNCYNEFRGAPYFQFGIYRLGRNKVRPKNPLPHHKRSYRNVRISLL